MRDPDPGRPHQRLSLQAHDVAAELDPAVGGRIASLQVDGLDLLVTEAAGPMGWGAYPMAPWAGRLRDGTLPFRGREHRFPLTLPPFAIHGTTWDRPWEVVEAGPAEATLAIALRDPWPFGGRAIHHVELEANGLRSTLEVHADEEPMPAIVGWHPWFPRRLARGGPVELGFEPGGMLLRGADGLPTGEVVTPPPGPWDDAFVEVREPIVVRWPGALTLELASPEAACWVVYTEPDHAICVEPQTGPPNGLATDQYTLVEPGRPLVATMTFVWRRSG